MIGIVGDKLHAPGPEIYRLCRSDNANLNKNTDPNINCVYSASPQPFRLLRD